MGFSCREGNTTQSTVLFQDHRIVWYFTHHRYHDKRWRVFDMALMYLT